MHYTRLALSLATLALMANGIPHSNRDDNAAYRPSLSTYTTDAEDIEKRQATQGTMVQLNGKNAGIPANVAPSQAKASPEPTQKDGHVFEQVGNGQNMVPRGKKPAGQGEIGNKRKHGSGAGGGNGNGKKLVTGGQRKAKPLGSGGPPSPSGGAPKGSGSAPPPAGGSPKSVGGAPKPKSGSSGGKPKKKSGKGKGKGQGSGSGSGGLPKQQQGNKDSMTGTPANSGGDTFNIHVVNSCPDTKTVGIFGVTSSFQATQDGQNQVVPSGGQAVLPAPFHGIGLRLTANADQGKDNVFQAQSLFEFGFSSFAGQDGTSYDLSLMQGAQIGMAVQVLDNGNGSGRCESKSCPTPQNCPASQGWTNPDQVNIGSPADTTCYKGKTDFKVTLCP